MSTRGSPHPPGPPAPHGQHGTPGPNPLRRPSDRFEAWFRRFLMLVLVVGLPLTAIGVGHTAYESSMRTVHEQTAQRHEVGARLTADVPGDNEMAKQPASVRWTDRGVLRTATVPVRPGTSEGATIRLWVDQDGHVTGPPANSVTAWTTGVFAGGMAALGLAVCLGATRGGVSLVVDRRRYARWDAEWELVEPQWSARFRR
ncbi:hypothetical protein ABZY20_11860 [Streptomyces sp. NPDC006624]|uniref:Rv1733c family protein n=1 Tax=unclassified Streptomyces TaxID=2593676 RepID=UPI0033BC8B0B